MGKYVSCLLILGLLLLAGCAGIHSPNFEKPVVSLQTFDLLTGSGVTPEFEVGLKIINPNREPLRLEGIFYTIEIEGYEVISGVSNDLPEVGAYDQASITLNAQVDLIRGLKLITSLLQEPRSMFRYNFKARLDTGPFFPKIIIDEEGSVNLQPGGREGRG